MFITSFRLNLHSFWQENSSSRINVLGPLTMFTPTSSLVLKDVSFKFSSFHRCIFHFEGAPLCYNYNSHIYFIFLFSCVEHLCRKQLSLSGCTTLLDVLLSSRAAPSLATAGQWLVHLEPQLWFDFGWTICLLMLIFKV